MLSEANTLGAVPRAVHQGVVQIHHIVGDAGRTPFGLRCEILAGTPAAREVEPGIPHALCGAGAADPGVIEHIRHEHPGAVFLGRCGQPLFELQGIKAARCPLIVDEIEHLTLERTCHGHGISVNNPG